MADNRYPPERGIWTLKSPSGKLWHGESPLDTLRREVQSRVPPEVMLERIFKGAYEDEPEPETAAQVWSKFWSKIKGKQGYSRGQEGLFLWCQGHHGPGGPGPGP